MGRFLGSRLRFDGSEVPGLFQVTHGFNGSLVKQPFPTVDGSEIRRSPPGMYKTL